MLRIYWCIGFAALLTASTLSAQQASDARSSQPSTEQSREISQGTPAPIASAIDRVADELAETRQDQSDPYGDERNKREKRDIIAQEESAKWARWNFVAIVLQTLLAGGALGAILYDIGQSRKSAETQTRAYVTLGNTDLRRKSTDAGKKSWFVDVDLENKGQTPAFVRRFDITVGWRRKDVAADIIDNVFSKSENIQVVIAADKPFGIWVEIEADFVPTALHYGDTLIVEGTITYLDIFEKERSTTYRLYGDKDSWEIDANLVTIHTSMTGNTCT